ncbi:hypothetical protein D3C81_1330130 [compost metagenome]
MNHKPFPAVLEDKRISAAQEIVQIALSAVSVKQRQGCLRSDVSGELVGQLTGFRIFTGDVVWAGDLSGFGIQPFDAVDMPDQGIDVPAFSWGQLGGQGRKTTRNLVGAILRLCG